MADQVFTKRTAHISGEDAPVGWAVEDMNAVGPGDDSWAENPPIEVSPWQMPSSFLDDLRKAARYGGVEFLSLILDASEEITNRHQSHLLPAPIDPSAI